MIRRQKKNYFGLKVLVNLQAGFNTPDLTDQLKSIYTVMENTSYTETYCEEVKLVHY